jgi:RecA-family ATPase
MKKVSLSTILAERSEQHFLIENIIPAGELSAVVGNSEAGKTQFCFQLAATVAAGEKAFLGLPIHTNSNKVLIVATEDSPSNIKMRFKGLLADKHKKLAPNIDLVTEVEEDPANVIDTLLQEETYGLIIVDTWTDLYTGEMNQNNDVRKFLGSYKRLAARYGCAIVFVHHFGKASAGKAKTKHHILGSQAFEAKMRSVVCLETTEKGKDRRMFLLKANLINEQKKRASQLLLTLNNNWCFINVEGLHIAKDTINNDDIKEQIRKLNIMDLSIDKVHVLLKEQHSVKVGRTRLAGLLKELRKETPS